MISVGALNERPRGTFAGAPTEREVIAAFDLALLVNCLIGHKPGGTSSTHLDSKTTTRHAYHPFDNPDIKTFSYRIAKSSSNLRDPCTQTLAAGIFASRHY